MRLPLGGEASGAGRLKRLASWSSPLAAAFPGRNSG